MTSFTIQTAKQEAKKAVLSWLIIYGVMFVALLGYRWDTKRYYISKQLQNQQQRLQVGNTSTTTSTNGPSVEVEVEIDPVDGNQKQNQQKQVIYRDPLLKPYQQPIRDLTKEVTTATQVLNQNLLQLETQITTLESLVSSSSSLNTKLDSIMSHKKKEGDLNNDDSSQYLLLLDGFKSLLSMKGLQQIPDSKRLTLMFQKATNEITKLINDDITITTTTTNDGDASSQTSISVWTYVDKVLDEMSQRERIPSSKDGLCPPTALSNNNNKNNNKKKKQNSRPRHHPDAVTVDELDYYIKTNFDPIFQQQRIASAGIQAISSPETKTQLLQQIDNTIATTIDDIITQAQEFIHQLKQVLEQSTATATIDTDSSDGTATSNSSKSSVVKEECNINRELIQTLVKAGIKAQTIGNDVRDELFKQLKRYDPKVAKEMDESEIIILDADLSSSTTTSTTTTSSSTVNLRDVIDTPLLVKSMDWIDQLVDIIGGYNDNLDRYLDSLMMTDSRSTSNSIGEVIVQQLLQDAGSIDIDPQVLADKHLPASAKEVVTKILLSGQTTTSTKED